MLQSTSFQPKQHALAVAISVAISGNAIAQTAADEAPKVDDEIIVIGQRFQNSLVNRIPIDPVEFPFSLEIIDQAVLDERGYLNPLDVLETVPNVSRRNTQYLPTGANYFIRGFTSTILTNNRPENDSRGAGRRDASQIERFEILKGPVSIVAGPGLPGGVVNQVTKSPMDEDFIELTARAGSYGTYRLEGDFNDAALFGSDVLSARLTVAQEDQGSPQDEAHAETSTIRPVIDIDFSEHTRAQFSVSYTEREAVPQSYFPVNSDGSIPDQIDAETYFGIATDHEGEDVYVDTELQHEFLDNLKLVVRGAYQKTDFEYQSAQGGYNYYGWGFTDSYTEATIYYWKGLRDSEILYTDVQLVGAFDAFGQQNDWVIGTSSQKFEFDNRVSRFPVLALVDINNLGGAVYPAPDFDSLTVNPRIQYEEDLDSIYAEINLRPADRLTIVTGVRYDEQVVNNDESFDDTTYRIGATYTFGENLNAYISYAESFNPQDGERRDGSLIGPETATSYEIGLKGTLAGGRLGFTATAFALTRENVETADPTNDFSLGEDFAVATGEQEHNGYELSAAFQATPGLGFTLAYGYLDAEVTSSISEITGLGEGDPIAMVPEHTFSASVTYVMQDGPLANLKMGLVARHISERPSISRFGGGRSWDIKYDGYTIVDALLVYPISDSLDIQLNVLNLNDEEYLETAGFSTGTPSGGSRFGNPRSAYVTLRKKF